MVEARITEYRAEHVVLLCFCLWVPVSFMDACLKTLFQQRLINVEYEGDWEWTKAWLSVHNPALLLRNRGMLCDVSSRTRCLRAGNQNQDRRISNRYTMHDIPQACCCAVCYSSCVSSFLRNRRESSPSSIPAPRLSRSGVGCFQLKHRSNAIRDSPSSAPPPPFFTLSLPFGVGWGEKRNKVTPCLTALRHNTCHCKNIFLGTQSFL
jgi:hypothetical protein